MKVTKAQAEANRALVVETASQLFRERGFDGVGVADLMAAAGFTHGGFYKQFGSKADLMAEATACGIAQTRAMAEGVDAATFVSHYLSREHRDGRATGCTMAALSGDAARQPESVRGPSRRASRHLLAAEPDSVARTRPMRLRRGPGILDVLSHAVGALVMSRACPDDSPLADEILAVCRWHAILPHSDRGAWRGGRGAAGGCASGPRALREVTEESCLLPDRERAVGSLHCALGSSRWAREGCAAVMAGQAAQAGGHAGGWPVRTPERPDCPERPERQ
jgi:TetR/AcrR family transcriptional repressor of nem operon